MSQCVNKIILVGFLGATPQLKFTAQAKSVCNFNLAVNERVRITAVRLKVEQSQLVGIVE